MMQRTPPLTSPPPSLSQADRDQLFDAVSYTKVQMKITPRSLPRLPLFLTQADRDQLFAAVSYTKVQMAAMMPLVTGIYQQTVQAAMQVGFRVLGLTKHQYSVMSW